ncbi:SDR family NAD(P)-dependent oxidoreductase [Limnobacter parvus]|uniref:SDR family oxidoreductase n=1 Tax=Limnobacter parvus TaxID=2939690 RepID=A0ABT1XIW0_9BURK|nr:SDR family NAD(P)-dependent oxidoreductase [Limnobacter parvus]MCR2747221.1 SDR family oxidoreductase [Limnobacter parvus]
MSINSPVAIVTGAAGNLGQAVAAHLGNLGYRLLLVDLKQPDWDGEGDAVSIGNVDLTLPEHADEVVAQAWEYFGQIDAVVNIAGGFVWERQVDSSLDTWNTQYAMNVQTAVNMCQAILPQFQAQQSGVLVNIGAAAAGKAAEGMGAYAAAKSAVLRLTEALAAENKHLGVRANAVLPSILDTPANREAMPDANPADWVTPESLAGIIAFLISDAARDINGAGIPVTGRV